MTRLIYTTFTILTGLASSSRAQADPNDYPSIHAIVALSDISTTESLYRLEYVHPSSTQQRQPLYSQNIPLMLWANAARMEPLEGEFRLVEKRKPPYVATYLPQSTTRWYVGDRLFSVDHSAFFGIEFDTSFTYWGGVVRVGDSSEKMVTILVRLYPLVGQ